MVEVCPKPLTLPIEDALMQLTISECVIDYFATRLMSDISCLNRELDSFDVPFFFNIAS